MTREDSNNRPVRHHNIAFQTQMPHQVIGLVAGTPIVNNLREQKVFTDRFMLSTVPRAQAYRVPGDEGVEELRAAQGCLVVDVYTGECVNDAEATEAKVKWLGDFMDKYPKIPKPIRDAIASGVVPVYRPTYQVPEHLLGTSHKRAYIPLGLIAGHSVDEQNHMSFGTDTRFFWVVTDTKKAAGGGSESSVVAIIFGNLYRPNPVGGYRQGRHRICIMETDPDSPLDILEMLAAAVFDSGWLEADTRVLRERFPDFDLDALPRKDAFLVIRGDGEGDNDDEAFKPRKTLEVVKVSEPTPPPTRKPSAPGTLFGVTLPEGEDAKWCTSANCARYQQLGLYPKGTVNCTGLQKDDNAECRRPLKVPNKGTEEKAKTQLVTLLAERKAAAQKAKSAAEPVAKPKKPRPRKKAATTQT